MTNNELYTLSYPQKDIYDIQNFYEKSSVNNIIGNVIFHSEMNPIMLHQAIEQLIEEQDAFHLKLIQKDNEVFQYIEEDHNPHIITKNFLHNETGYNAWLKEMNEENLDILDDPLYLFAIYTHPDGRNGYYFRLNHIISDAWTMTLIVNHVQSNYIDLMNNENYSVPETSYVEFLEREKKYLESKRFQKDKDFWMGELSDLPKVKLFDGMGKKQQGNADAKRSSFTLSKEMTNQIHQFCEKAEVSVLTFFISSISTYLYKLTSNQDFMLGTAILNRTSKREKNMVGMFINSIPIRVQLEEETTFLNLNNSMHKKFLSLLRHQKYPHHLLMNDIHKKNDTPEKLYDVMVSYQNSSLDNAAFPYYEPEWLFNGQSINTLALHINDRENTGEIEIDYDYLTEVFTTDDIEKMNNYLGQMIENLLNNEAERLERIDILNENEIKKLTKDNHDTYYPNKLIHEIFEEQVSTYPASIAIEADGQEITYQELNERANQLASYLRMKQVKKNDIISLYMEPSTEMIVSILAVLKVGAAYLPIHTSFPIERINYMLEDSATRYMLATADNLSWMQANVEFSGEILNIHDDHIQHLDTENIVSRNRTSDLAYIIYTSGSTGNPKGVMISHENVVQLMMHQPHPFTITNQDVWTMFHSYSFDFSVWEMYGAFLYGGKLVIIPEEATVDPAGFIELLVNKKVTVLSQTPSAFYNLMREDQTGGSKDYQLRYVVFGGEALKPIKLKAWKQKYPNIELINMYGITETTVHVTYKQLTMEDIERNISNAGEPLPPLDVYIMNNQLQMQPQGIIGEICVTGAGVAKGYLNKPELTEAVFVPNPFKIGQKMYRSGDLGRILPSGDIEYIGRKDFQVKIRGYRVELGEIEREILRLEFMKDCVVLNYLDKSENNSLCAYVISNQEINPFEIRKQLAERLPEYMIPARYVAIDEVPLTSNGKVDREVLAQIRVETENNQAESISKSMNVLEEKLADIWKQELKLTTVDIDDNFFDIGGHSLNASYLTVQINRILGINLTIRDIFNFPTIELLAKFIETLDLDAATQQIIQPTEKKMYYPVTSAEQRMFTLWEFDKQSVAYNMPGAFRIEGEFNLEQLRMSLQHLAARHDILRSTYQIIDGELKRKIADPSEQKVNIKLFEIKKEELTDELLASLVEPFDLHKESLMRIYVLKMSETENVLLMDMHHIISDAFTVEQLLIELSAIYNDEFTEKLELQYQDYAVWEEQFKQSDEYQRQKTYWLNEFQDKLPIFKLPVDYHRAGREDFSGDSRKITLNRSQYEKLKSTASSLDVSMYMYLLTCYEVLLSKWANEEEVVVGIPVNGRSLPETQEMTGMFVNTLVHRDAVYNKMEFMELLQSVKGRLLESLNHKDYSFDELVRDLNLSGQNNGTPLIDTVFVWNENAKSHLQLKKTVIHDVPLEHAVERFQLTFQVNELEDELEFEISYSDALYDERTIDYLLEIYSNIVVSVLSDEKVQVKDIALKQSPVAFKDILNDVPSDYPNSTRTEVIFEQQVQLHPDKIAIHESGRKITYQELNNYANHIGAEIVERNIPIGARVAVCMEESITMIASLIGTLKAGCTYVPIDPELPNERRRYILKDANCELILTDGNQEQTAVQTGIPFISIDEDYSNSPAPLLKKQAEQLNANQPIYIMYTSGSTGKPKGVIISHYNVNRLVRNQNFIDITPEDNLLQLSNYAFDGSVFDIYGALLNGAALTLITKEDTIHLKKLAEVIRNNGVTISFMTTALFNTIVETRIDILGSITNKILFGGERVSLRHVDKAFQSLGRDRLIHVYGPTEGTVYSSYYPVNHELRSSFTVPIGKAISNTQLYVLNEDYQLCPPTIPGELYVGGDGLAQGYVNLADMNEQVFVQSPFHSDEKLYRTGDLVVINSEGDLVFLDRIDKQVKIRGYRIELSEIEQVIANIDGVREVYVTSLKDGNKNDVQLAAYVVADRRFMTRELAHHLPSYMIPGSIHFLDKLPLNQNGKIDTSKLPKNVSPESLDDLKVGFESREEELLARMWEENLSVPSITRDDHYFQAGGHSLKAAILAEQISNDWNVEFTIKDILENPVLKEMSARILEKKNKEQQWVLNKAEEKNQYSLSYAEKSMYLLWLANPSEVAYNIPTAIRLKGQVDIEALQSAFKKFIERHEALQTSYHLSDDGPYKVIKKGRHAVRFEQIEMLEKQVDSLEQWMEPFDLGGGEVIRAKLFKEADDQYVLFIEAHHIASDGKTIQLLYEELASMYNGEVLELSRYQYKDYAEWQQTYAQSENWLKDEAYWLNEFDGSQAVLNFPTDYERSSEKSYRGKKISIQLEELLLKQLNNLAVQTDSTLYMVMMSIFGMTLSKFANQNEIVIGTPADGRFQTALSDVAGMFVNTLPIKLDVDWNQKTEQYLSQTKQKITRAIDHQNYPFEEIVSQLQLTRENERNPLFDVMFAMNYTNYDSIKFNDLESTQVLVDHQTEKFDMTLEMNYSADGNGELILTYAADLFAEQTMSYFLSSFIAIGQQLSYVNRLSELTMTSSPANVLDQLNATATKIEELSIIERLKRQVKNTPEQMALVEGNVELTYRELWSKVENVSNMLQSKGVEKGTKIAIVLGRSIDYIVSVLSVLKLGAIFIPIDVSYPKERKTYMIHDSDASFVITKSEYNEAWLSTEQTIAMDIVDLKEYAGRKLVATRRELDELVYILYTSGSTGNPKGVKIKESGLINYLDWSIKQYGPKWNMSLFTSISFDLTITSVFIPLLTGSSLTIYPESDDEFVRKIFENERLDIVKLTPAHLRILNQYPKFTNHIHSIIVGGEALPAALCQSISEKYPGIRIFNEYGPTEATIGCIVHQYGEADETKSTVQIGYPIQNTKIYILDEYKNILPAGAIGEIYIGGIQVADGYLNNPEKTKESFIYNERLDIELYRTGDYGRVNGNGAFEYLGRKDTQVKVRGYRIELEEIESQLLEMLQVKDAVVLVQSFSSGAVDLVAYIVSEEEIEIEDMKAQLSIYLPAYMIPSVYIFVDHIPLTNNGKVDRKRLRSMGDIDHKDMTDIDFDLTDEEELLLHLVRKVLKLDHISIRQNFFAIGGNSLLSIYLLNEIAKKFGVKLEVADIFRQQTLQGIANEIKKQKSNKIYQPIPKVAQQEWHVASSSQKRMYVNHATNPVGITYNMPITLNWNGIDPIKVKETLNKQWGRHRILRSNFKLEDGEVWLKVEDSVPLEVPIIDATNQEDFEIQQLVQPFDLSEEPLLRAIIIKNKNGSDYLFLDMPHIILDGISMNQFVKEFVNLYHLNETRQPTNHLKDLDYIDFIAWQNELLASPILQRQEAYWLHEFKDIHLVKSLPYDKDEASIIPNTPNGEQLKVRVPALLNQQLTEFTQEYGTTKYIVLLAAMSALLDKYSVTGTPVIGTPVSGRNHPDTNGMLGLFINTLAIQMKPIREETATQYVKRVKEKFLTSIENSDYPYEELINHPEIRQPLQNHNLFEVMFVYQNEQDVTLQIGDFTSEVAPVQTNTAKFNLTIAAIENRNKQLTELIFEYRRDLFNESTIEVLVEQYLTILEQMLQPEDIAMMDLALMKEKEEKKEEKKEEIDLSFEF
ncbi:non-ribosomal peptide synthetase [Oceanobacillus alkalisoli]|uniref:non-ribosomal peptide synthetase n=1 Tax=Oceanobacillus alkalisoli TaxID=2925113 RepID=UPI001EE47394|nr:non-ribosomal peptide synthetase [Oceanobacillus alkalisoli]MCG5104728.1 amino acid adenylation domain-containing protein [Oceanobacillus alkalisoli]